jgi:hypothetical protein
MWIGGESWPCRTQQAAGSTGPGIPHHPLIIDGSRIRRAASIRLVDPRADETEMGPLANEPQYRKGVSFFASAANEGATRSGGVVQRREIQHVAV